MWNVFKTKQAPIAERSQAFWQWFQANEAMLSNYAADQERVFKLVAKELDKVHPLSFEFGPGHGDKRDFVISADGIKKDFPTVAALCKIAPPLARFNIVAFRQRKQTQGVMHSHGVAVNLDDCAFSAEKTEAGLIDLVLYMKGLTPDTYRAYGSAGFLILDTIIGEFDVATKVGAIDFERLSDETIHQKKLSPLRELRSTFDGMQSAPSTVNLSGAWAGYYSYAAGQDTEPEKRFPFKAQLTTTGIYLEGTMDDNSELGQASLSGFHQQSVVLFNKTYSRADIDPVLYHGGISADGQSMSGKWQLDGKRQSLEGIWFMQHE